MSNDDLYRDDSRYHPSSVQYVRGRQQVTTADPLRTSEPDEMEYEMETKGESDRETIETDEPVLDTPADQDIETEYGHGAPLQEAAYARSVNDEYDSDTKEVIDHMNALLAQIEAEAPEMEKTIEEVDKIADRIFARANEKRMAKEHVTAASRVEVAGRNAEEAIRSEETIIENPLPQAFEGTQTGGPNLPSDDMNILSDGAEQLSLGDERMPAMFPRDKRRVSRISEDSSFTKAHPGKKHDAGLDQLPEYNDDSDTGEQTAPRRKKRSFANLLSRTSNFSLNLIGMKSTAALAGGPSSPDPARADTDAVGVQGDAHGDEITGGVAFPPGPLPDRIDDIRAWDGSKYVPLDDFVTPGSQAHITMLEVCNRVNLRIGGHLRNSHKNREVPDHLPACQTCRQINMSAPACNDDSENLTKKTVCQKCIDTGNHPCCRLVGKPGGYFFGFVPLSLHLRPDLAPDDEFYWKVKREAKKRKSKSKSTKVSNRKDSGKKEGTRQILERKTRQLGRVLMS